MKLSVTKRGQYGFRMLLHLASREQGERMTAAELSEECDISAGNVPTILNTLSRAGILQCSPGRSGGCTLARPAEEISALEVIEALEGPIEIAHCLLDSTRCHGKDPECALHEAWSVGRNAAIAALAHTTLADAARREAEIHQLLAGD